MNCTHCGKRLSRKTARQIDDVIMCSTCMFKPASERKQPDSDQNPKGGDGHRLRAKHAGAGRKASAKTNQGHPQCLRP